jgi:ribose-phosphate pyrophosphokinase
MNIVGDVRGKKAVIVDDIIDTAGTLSNAAHAIINAGAASVSACASHAVFSGKAVQRITDSPLQHVIVTNTIPQTDVAAACAKVRVKSVGRLLGEAIKRIHHGDSISSLFV